MTAPTRAAEPRPDDAVELLAPAKLTTSLRVVGVRPDGYHLLEAEMVSLDLADSVEITPAQETHLTVVDDAGGAPLRQPVPVGADNLVVRALEATSRRARVRLVKRIPAGAGLGGGSSDAAAVLRWAGCVDVEVACRLGADVPFCLTGGRARVEGIGERVTPLPYEPRHYVVLLLPFGVSTADVYRAWDEAGGTGTAPGRTGGADRVDGDAGGNDLEAAALRVEPRLLEWRSAFERLTGHRPRLAGSGSTWFVEGTFASLGIEDDALRVGEADGHLRAVRSMPAFG